MSRSGRSIRVEADASEIATIAKAIEDTKLRKSASMVHGKRSLAVVEHDDSEMESTIQRDLDRRSHMPEDGCRNSKIPPHQTAIFVSRRDCESSTNSRESYDDEEQSSSPSSQHLSEPLYEAELVPYREEMVVERVFQRLMNAATPAQTVRRVEDSRRPKLHIESMVRKEALFMLLMVIIAAIVVVVTIFTGPNGGGRNATSMPTATPSKHELQGPTESPITSAPTIRSTDMSPREQELREMLASVLDTSQVDDPESSQYKALQWLLTSDEYVLGTTPEVSERFALAVFFFSFEWFDSEVEYYFLIEDKHHCDWIGENHTVECSWNKLVTTLDFEVYGIQGTLPSELRHLTMLQTLKLRQGLTGTIPSELGTLAFLEELDLERNELRGTIPSSLFGLPKLSILTMHSNSLTGTIPSNLGDCKKLGSLDLFSNSLTGPIPSSVNSLTLLQHIELDMNGGLTGTIPPFLHCRELKTIFLSHNSFTGTIPTELFNNRKLTLLALNHNVLEGTLPTEVGLLTDLETLWVQQNMLSGVFPPLTTNLQLRNIDIRENDFSGRLDQLLEGLGTHLVDFGGEGNSFTGSIPSWIGTILLEGAFGLSNNRLSGTIPTEIGLLTDLTELNLNGNRFDGTVPTEFGGLFDLTRLEMQENRLEGRLPSELGRLSELLVFMVYSNALSGPIPSEVGQMSRLTELDVCCNKFNGTLPTELSKISRLSDFYLEENMLTGSIPSSWSLSNFPDLVNFDLHQNYLTGDLSRGFCDDNPTASDLNLISDCGGPDAEVQCSCCRCD